MNGEERKTIRRLGSDATCALLLDTSKAYIWKKSMEDPSFPKPIRLGPRCTRWDLNEIEEWVHARREEIAA